MPGDYLLLYLGGMRWRGDFSLAGTSYAVALSRAAPIALLRLEDVSKMVNVCLRRSSSFMLVLTALVIAGCGRSASTDKAKEAPGSPWPIRSSAAWWTKTTTTAGWRRCKTVEVRARVRGHITEGPLQGRRHGQGRAAAVRPRPAPRSRRSSKQAEAQAKALEAQKVAAEKDVERDTESDQVEARFRSRNYEKS